MADNFKETVKAIRKGDNEAYAELYNEIYDELYYFALLNLKNSKDASDIVISTAVTSFENFEKFDSFEDFKLSMVSIITEKVLKRQNTYSNTPEFKASSNIKTPLFKETPEESKFINNDLLAKIDGMDTLQKLVYSLYLIFELPTDEISKLIKIKKKEALTLLENSKTYLKHVLNR